MTAQGLVLLLDGPAGVGKTATIGLLQRRWPEVRPGPLVQAGLDQGLAALGPSFARWWPLIRTAHRDDDLGGGQLGWGPLGRELIVALHRVAAAWSLAGFDVAVDHILLDRATLTDLAESLEGLQVLHVGLTCEPEELARREESRSDRTLGRAVAQLEVTRDVAVRDAVVDTTNRTVEDVAEVVLRHVRRFLEGAALDAAGP